MDNQKTIRGRTATFDMLTSPSIVGEIKYAPTATGDSWIVQDKDGATHYIQTFASMRLEPEE